MSEEIQNAQPNKNLFGIDLKGDRIAVAREELQDKHQVDTDKFIIMPTQGREAANKGIVVAIGEGRILESGVVIPPPFNIGDIVVFEKYSPTEIQVNGNDVAIIGTGSVLCTIVKYDVAVDAIRLLEAIDKNNSKLAVGVLKNYFSNNPGVFNHLMVDLHDDAVKGMAEEERQAQSVQSSEPDLPVSDNDSNIVSPIYNPDNNVVRLTVPKPGEVIPFPSQTNPKFNTDEYPKYDTDNTDNMIIEAIPVNEDSQICSTTESNVVECQLEINSSNGSVIHAYAPAEAEPTETCRPELQDAPWRAFESDSPMPEIQTPEVQTNSTVDSPDYSCV